MLSSSFVVPMTWISLGCSTTIFKKTTKVFTFQQTNSKTRKLMRKHFAQIMKLPVSSIFYEVTNDQVLHMFNELGHQPLLTGIIQFKKLSLPCIYSFLFGIVLRCLIGRSSGLQSQIGNLLYYGWALLRSICGLSHTSMIRIWDSNYSKQFDKRCFVWSLLEFDSEGGELRRRDFGSCWCRNCWVFDYGCSTNCCWWSNHVSYWWSYSLCDAKACWSIKFTSCTILDVNWFYCFYCDFLIERDWGFFESC